MPRKDARGPKRKGRYVFTKEDCQKGYQAALAKCTEAGWDRLAWFVRKMRGEYREKQREANHGQKES